MALIADWGLRRDVCVFQDVGSLIIPMKGMLVGSFRMLGGLLDMAFIRMLGGPCRMRAAIYPPLQNLPKFDSFSEGIQIPKGSKIRRDLNFEGI